ncbi:hypothetical protein DFH09DRAFT_1311656 [Mycena vulgaris]|nr:hypothetical protein DFH09DRAFT_1311656 [Mycena vulgaris]
MCRGHCLASGGCLCHEDKPTPQTPIIAGRQVDFAGILKAYVGTLLISRSDEARLSILHKQQQHAATLAQRTPLPPSPTASDDAQYAALIALSGLPPPSPRFTSATSASTSYSAGLQASPKLSISHRSISVTNFDSSCRLVLVYWPTNGPAIVQAVDDQDRALRRSWPLVRLSDLAHLITDQDHPTVDEFYQCFSTIYHSWMKIHVDYLHKLSTDQFLYIRRLGVIGSDEDRYVPRIATAAMPHRASKRKGKSRMMEASDTSDDEVVIVGYRPAIKQEPVTPPCKSAKRPRLVITILDDAASASTPSLSYSASTASSLSLPSLGSSPDFPTNLISPKGQGRETYY